MDPLKRAVVLSALYKAGASEIMKVRPKICKACRKSPCSCRPQVPELKSAQFLDWALAKPTVLEMIKRSSDMPRTLKVIGALQKAAERIQRGTHGRH